MWLTLGTFHWIKAFGLTGLAGTDMLSKLTTTPPPLIFMNTLYHFQETLELKDEVARRYNVQVHVFKPLNCDTVEEFEKVHGERLWEKDEATYDYAVKVLARCRFGLSVCLT